MPHDSRHTHGDRGELCPPGGNFSPRSRAQAARVRAEHRIVAATAAPAAHVKQVVREELDGRRALLGWSVIALLVAIPLVIYAVGAEKLGTRGGWFVAGEVIGIMAATLLPLSAILAVRLRPLEWLFGDMTQVYVAHGITGLLMLGLVTAHPLFYVAGTLPETREAAHVMVPFHLVALDWVSWICIVTAMVPTLFLHLRFDTWRWTHMLLGTAVVLTAVSLTITSREFDTIAIPALRAYLFLLFGLAIAAVVWVALVRRATHPKLEYRVTRAEQHPDAGAVELTLEPVGAALRFAPGQFTYVDLLDERVQLKRDVVAHPFSVASAPGTGALKVIVQGAGRYTEKAQAMATEDDARALVRGAYGQLGHVRAVRQVWIGGGVGVTPFLGLADHLVLEDDPARDVVFVVAVRHAADAFYLERLREAEARHPGFRVVVWDHEERGRLTAEALADEVPDLAGRHALISGPESLIHDLSHQLHHDAGVPRAHIHSEVAVGPPKRWKNAPTGLRVARGVVAAELVLFLGVVVASVVGRALF